jgi:hypothetical protein
MRIAMGSSEVSAILKVRLSLRRVSTLPAKGLPGAADFGAKKAVTLGVAETSRCLLALAIPRHATADKEHPGANSSR